ncbi:MAG: hypothetical protein QXL98_02610, partial [Thermofilaceae archaeon]
MFLAFLVLSSHLAACQPQVLQLRINQSEKEVVNLTNATFLVEVNINLEQLNIKSIIDDIELILYVPKILENKIIIGD